MVFYHRVIKNHKLTITTQQNKNIKNHSPLSLPCSILHYLFFLHPSLSLSPPSLSHQSINNKHPEQLHQPNRRFHPTIILINPHNGIRPGHNDLPDNLLDDLMGLEEAILGHLGLIAGLFEFDELACTHPQVIDMPALEDVPEVFSEQ